MASLQPPPQTAYEASALPVSGDVVVRRLGGGAGGRTVPAAEALAIWKAVERHHRELIEISSQTPG